MKMLLRKALRDMKSNLGQFIGIFLLAFLAVALFACMKASNISGYKQLDKLYTESNAGNGWLFGEGFSKEDADKIAKLSDVKDIQRRMHITAQADAEHDNAQLEVFLEDDNIVSKPFLREGEEFDPKDTEHIWITKFFADEWKLKVGDDFTFTYNGIKMTKKVAGLISAPEYQRLQADKDVDIVLKNIAVIYMSYDAFPFGEYLKSLVRSGDLTSDMIGDYTDMEVPEGMELTEDQLIAYIEQIEEKDNDNFKKYRPYTELVFTSDNDNVKGMEQQVSDAIDGNYAVFCDRDNIIGMRVIADELEQHDQFSYLFTIIFLAIAILVIMTTMKRIISSQRTQIGTLSALGVSRKKIIFHYLSYSFIVSALGSVLELIVGTYSLGNVVAEVFRVWYDIPGWAVDVDYTFIVVTLVVIFCCMLSTYLSCRKELNVHPAESLRPAPPKSAKSCIFEHLPFWKKLGFSAQYNLRDISRGKLRAVMAIFGCAAGMMIMVAAFSSYTTVNSYKDWTFNKIQKYNTQIDFDSSVTKEYYTDIAEKYDGELIMHSSVEIAVKENALADDRKTCTLTVTEGKNFFGITDSNLDPTKLKEGKIALTARFAKSLGVKEGDKLWWHLYDKNEWHCSEIGLINRNPSIMGITMLRSDYEETGEKYVPSSLLTNEGSIDSSIENNKMVSSVHGNDDIKKSLDVSLDMINVIIWLFLFFSIVLTTVVLYSCGNLSFNERIKEFATLKVLGFSTSRIRSLLSRQNFALSLIGLVIGAPFGVMMLQYMFDSNGEQAADFACSATIFDYAIAGLLVLITSVLVSFLFTKRIKRINMVEVLKGIE